MLNRQSKSAIVGAVLALCAAGALAEPAAATGNPVVQMAQDSTRPQNPLEEMSRLNAEVATLRAKLNLVDLKSQIKKKEDEMLPPKPAEKSSVKEAKPDLPPLPNFGNLPQTGSFGGLRDMPAAAPKVPDVPHVVAIEGFEGDLYADIQSDWGGYARVRAHDMYHEYHITEVTPNYVKAKNAKGQIVQLAVMTAAVQKLQARAQGAQSNGSDPMSMSRMSLPMPAYAPITPASPSPVVSDASREPVISQKPATSPNQSRAIARRNARR
jgi:hypothetical protein